MDEYSDLTITGDLDMRCTVKRDDWRPSGQATIIGKRKPWSRNGWSVYARRGQLVMREGGWALTLGRRTFYFGGQVLARCSAPPDGLYAQTRMTRTERSVYLGWSLGDGNDPESLHDHNDTMTEGH